MKHPLDQFYNVHTVLVFVTRNWYFWSHLWEGTSESTKWLIRTFRKERQTFPSTFHTNVVICASLVRMSRLCYAIVDRSLGAIRALPIIILYIESKCPTRRTSDLLSCTVLRHIATWFRYLYIGQSMIQTMRLYIQQAHTLGSLFFFCFELKIEASEVSGTYFYEQRSGSSDLQPHLVSVSVGFVL